MIIKQREIDLALKEACKSFHDESRLFSEKERHLIRYNKIIQQACVRLRKRIREVFLNLQRVTDVANDSVVALGFALQGVNK